MYGTYLRRELIGRPKQTIIVTVGMAIAIALVIVVNALSAGMRDAQASALESVYGVGTDLTVTGAQAEPGQPGEGGPQFNFDDGAGSTAEDGSTTLSQSRLMTDMMRGTLDAAALLSVSDVEGVSAATATLSLTSVTFDGELPQAPTGEGADSGADSGSQGAPPNGGQAPGGGFAGGSFGVNSFTVLGVEPGQSAVGPLSAVELTEGRMLQATDTGSEVTVVDATYAASNELAVGDSIEVGGAALEIVGIVASTSSDADTAANVYLPLDTAQVLSDVEGVVSTIYVQAESATVMEAVQASIEDELAGASVSSQSELAGEVSGSLSSATSLITNLGTWLSIIVLLVAVALAVLLTVSGVTRRTREFGTLKAIGWSNGRVVSQVAGESVVQGLLGGAMGLVLGIGAAALITALAPTISGGSTAAPAGQGGFPAGGPGGPGQVTSAASDIVLSAPVSIWIALAAVGLAVAGGLIAGAFGGWRAARLCPAEALRSAS